MAKYVIEDSTLTSIADAIRSKGNTTEDLKPSDMPAAIAAILTAGEVEDALIDGSILGNYVNDRVTKIRAYAFRDCDALTSVSFANVTSIFTSAFQGCSSLKTINFPNVKKLNTGSAIFYGCSALENVNMPNLDKVETQTFYNCDSLTTFDAPLVSIGSVSFENCNKLTTFIIRQGSQVCYLSSTSAFRDTPIQSGTGYIYVPAALIEDYKTATNWTSYATQLRAIEDYPEITGGTV